MNQFAPRSGQAGFTLIELLIVVAIIGILAAIAVPQYQVYASKGRYTEVVNYADSRKKAVEACGIIQAGLANCTGGSNGVPADIAVGGNPTTYVGGISTLAGVITVTPRAAGGIDAADTFILTPTYSATGGITWAVTCTDTTLC